MFSRRYFANSLIVLLTSLLAQIVGNAQSPTLDSLYNIVRTSNVQIDVADAHGGIAWTLIDTDMNVAQAHLDTANIIYINEQDAYGISRCEYQTGVMNRKKGGYEKALTNFDRYMAYVDTVPDRVKAAGMAYYCGFQYAAIYEEQGDYEKSLKTLFSLLAQDDWEANNSDKSNLHNSIGILYSSLEKYNEAKKHFNLALSFIEDSAYKVEIANVYRNLTDIYVAEGNSEKAQEFILKSIDIFKSVDHNYGVAMGFFDMGRLFLDQGNLDDAEQYLILARDVFEKNNHKDKKLTYISLGEIYLKKNKMIDAEYYYQKAVKLDLRKSDDMIAQKGLVNLYKKKRNFEKALFHFEKYLHLKDSLAGIETLKDINRLQFQYESTRKDKEILSQNLKIQEQKNIIVLEESNSTRNLLLACTALGGLIFSFFYYRQRQRLKNNEIEVLKSNQEINKLEARIAGEEKERSRLAQDLHDGINGDLSVIKYKITSIDKNQLGNEEAKEYKRAVSMLDNAIEQVRSISHDLAPPSLQNYNIIEALSEFCLKMSSGSNLTINFQHFGDVVSLSDESETAIYRIVQELLNNSIRHAEADNVLVQINFHKNDLHISVEDDGKGYDFAEIKRGLGLNNINSRARFLGADINVESSGSGTLTTLNINLKNCHD